MESTTNPLTSPAAGRESASGGAGMPYDWCIVFPKEAMDPGGKGLDVVQEIQAAKVKVYMYYSHDKDQVFLLLRVPEEILHRFADMIDYKVLLRY
jgi:hypothetical protein